MTITYRQELIASAFYALANGTHLSTADINKLTVLIEELQVIVDRYNDKT